MKALPTAPMLRIFILLSVICAAAFIWETSRNGGLEPVSGRVVGMGYRDCSIRYSVDGQNHQLVTRLGIIDLLGGLRSLNINDPVPVLANPAKPDQAVINTVNGRYGITLTFVTLLLVFVVVIAASLSRRGRAKPR